MKDFISTAIGVFGIIVLWILWLMLLGWALSSMVNVVAGTNFDFVQGMAALVAFRIIASALKSKNEG
jgi:hypothetical protein